MSRKTYSEVRGIIMKELKRDLIGPEFSDKDIISEAPSQAYLTGILFPLDSENEDEELMNEIYIPKDSSTKDENSESNDEEPEIEVINTTKIGQKRQNSFGLKFYVEENVQNLEVLVQWGEYKKIKKFDEKKVKEIPYWERTIISHNINIDLSRETFKKKLIAKNSNDIDNIYLFINKTPIKDTSNFIVSIFLMNNNVDKTNKKSIYQVSLEVKGKDEEKVFLCENKARKNQGDYQEFLYRHKPIFAKGFGCAVEWTSSSNEKASLLRTSFIPSHEVEGMSTELPRDKNYKDVEVGDFSIKMMSKAKNKDNILFILDNLAKRYESWIQKLPLDDVEDKNSAQVAIEKCVLSLSRIREGIDLLRADPKAYKAFQFMNEVMHTQISMKNYAANNENTTLELELEKENFDWRPFQLAFILLNIKSIVKPESEDRELVDLLWFPTGGGKTEAYLGIIAFLLAYRRLTNDIESPYNKDGGVTIILRYTLRLLTTQQRDRLMRLISAAEYIRVQKKGEFGFEEFSIGFWVGSQVTANKFETLQEAYYREAWEVEKEYNKLRKQVIECPCCGTKNPVYNLLPNASTSTPKTGLKINCRNKTCYFFNNHMPIYLIDEEIYRKTPSIIISTVDKFARLPWEEKTATIFGKVNRYCEKCGYIGEGEKHEKSHRNPAAQVLAIKPFYPPELIIQDELHLITGPLGTIYGLYETAIEELATADVGSERIKPKYIAATATIKNADEQIIKVFGRQFMSQFPPSGLSIEDSFFGREKDVESYPFRMYSGVCVSGSSMKTVVLRVFAILLQVTETLKTDPKYSSYTDYIDPYRTLIGYFNSVRELGGAVRLMDDDVRKRIQTLKKKYGYIKERYPDRTEELTSRIPSYRIPKVLELLGNPMGENEIDVALATNMISVGMDVDRLGLMVVNGQPKQTSEYIQASSRVGRSKPGLVVTIYNPYRPRDLSHYENFKGYHSRLYNYVEGTTATPFAARARDRALHALVVAVLRLSNNDLAKKNDAANIKNINLMGLRKIISERVTVSDTKNKKDTMMDLNKFIDEWIKLSTTKGKLVYYTSPKKNVLPNGEVRLLSRHNDIKPKNKNEYDTLDSMRQIESTSKIFIKERWGKN